MEVLYRHCKMTIKKYQKKINQARPLILLAGGLLILSVSLTLLKNNLNMHTPATIQYIPPLEVRVVNENDTGFSVSWVTKEAVEGYLVYSLNRDEVQGNDTTITKVGDIRGDNTYITHLVTINNLNPGERYYFKIVNNKTAYFLSADSYWREEGIAESVRLPVNPGWSQGAYSLETKAFSECINAVDGKVLLSCYRPNFIWGVVNNIDGQVANDAIVIIDIPGKTNSLATTTNSDGRWAINLANLWNETQTDYAKYMPGIDLIRIVSLAKDAKASLYQPIPSVMNQSETVSPIVIKLQPASLINPEVTPEPSLTPTTTPIVTIIPKIPTPSSQPKPANQIQLQIYFPLKDTDTLRGNVEIKDTAGRWSNVKVTLNKVDSYRYRGLLVYSKTGEHDISFQPEGYLKSSLGKLTIKTGTSYLENASTNWIAGDVNGDNQINIIDLCLLISDYHKSKPTTSADFNGDGIIDVVDLSLLIHNYYGI